MASVRQEPNEDCFQNNPQNEVMEMVCRMPHIQIFELKSVHHSYNIQSTYAKYLQTKHRINKTNIIVNIWYGIGKY